jgi:hypothetical protein
MLPDQPTYSGLAYNMCNVKIFLSQIPFKIWGLLTNTPEHDMCGEPANKPPSYWIGRHSLMIVYSTVLWSHSLNPPHPPLGPTPKYQMMLVHSKNIVLYWHINVGNFSRTPCFILTNKLWLLNIGTLTGREVGLLKSPDNHCGHYMHLTYCLKACSYLLHPGVVMSNT